MADLIDRLASLVAELKRRRVFRALGLYLVGAWAAIEVTATVFPLLLLPEWTSRAVVMLAVLGLPLVAVGSWAYDLTREGIRRAEGDGSRVAGRGMRSALVGVTVVLTGAVGWGAKGVWLSPEAGRGEVVLDPSRVAVLYLDDFSEGGRLGYVAEGLTEALIHELAKLEPLEVVSRNGVKPYRELTIPLDSLSRLLRVGTVVTGSVEGGSGRLGATIQLIDARTGAHLLSQRFQMAEGDILTLRDSLVSEVGRSLGRALGQKLDVERRRQQTDNGEAWARVQRARSLMEEADTLQWTLGAVEPARAALERADSLLAAAAELDPDWIEPLVTRAQVARQLAGLDSDASPERDEAEVERGLRLADTALERDPEHGAALALRGALRLDLSWRRPDSADVLTERAEADLRRAVAADTANALGWAWLAELLRSRGDFAEAAVAAERALAADPFLIHAGKEVLFTLGHIWLELEQFERAERWAREGRHRYPAEPAFAASALALTSAWAGSSAPPDSAWALVRVVEEAHQIPLWSDGHLLAAAALARGGLGDSARAVVRRVREQQPDDPWLDYYEANVRLRLDEPEQALTLLEAFLTEVPHRRSYIASEWWWRPLRGSPRFQALVGSP